jgi:hypothetical protein
MGGGLVYRGGVIAVIFVLTAFAPNSAQAQAALPSAFAPVATPLIDPDLLKPPQAPPRVDADKFNADRSAKGVSAWSSPRGIDLGTYQLQFDANHTSAVRAPRIDMDSGESANLSKIAPGKRQESALPNYFGFKLSAPTH